MNVGNYALFQVSTLVWHVFRPSSFIVLLIGVGVALNWAGRRWLGRSLQTFGIAALFACGLLPVGQWAIATLEQRYPPVEAPPDHVDGILILGGAVEPALTERWHQPALNDDAARMTVVTDLMRRYPDARVVFTGGGGLHGPNHLREADVARQLFLQFGLPQDHMLYESDSLNTDENARFSYRLVNPGPDEHWLLVTSAFHMPRAMATFRHAGWNVSAWPVAFKSGDDDPAAINLPTELRLLDCAAHEWVGLIDYKLTGRG